MKKLYRNRMDVMIAGVCSGLANYFGIDPTIVRLIFVILLLAGLGGLWLYVILWIIMPLRPTGHVESVEVQGKEKHEEPLNLAESITDTDVKD